MAAAKNKAKKPEKVKGGSKLERHTLLFNAEPMVHPHVLDAYEKACQALKVEGIDFRTIGGLAMNMHGAGRPTKDVDLLVARKDWLKALDALRKSIATDTQGIRFGLPGEPTNGLAIIGPHGVPVEIWPEGTTHAQIAKVRGAHKSHPAGRLALRLSGDETVNLLNSKLASYLSATDRLRDAADVQSIIKKMKLPLEYGTKLATAVRPAYRRIWQGRI